MCQTMNSVRSNNLSLKYQRFTPSGCKDIGIIKFEFVAKTQVLLDRNTNYLPLVRCKNRFDSLTAVYLSSKKIVDLKTVKSCVRSPR